MIKVSPEIYIGARIRYQDLFNNKVIMGEVTDYDEEFCTIDLDESESTGATTIKVLITNLDYYEN